MPTPDTLRQLLVAFEACESKKGEDTRILSLDPADSGLADFFLITSATNDRQVVAIADEIEFRLKQDFGLYASSVEGRRQGEWILLDYVDIVIHVFLQEKRAFYDIERLRKSARNLTGADVEQELQHALAHALAEKTRAVRKSAPAAKKIPTKASSRKSPTTEVATPIVQSKGGSTMPSKPAKKAAAKKAAAKVEVKTAPAKKAAVTKAPAKKAAVKKAPAKKAAAKKAVVPAIEATASAPRQGLMGRGAKPPVVK